MRRSLMILAAFAAVATFSTQAAAFQCPKLVGQINTETSNRMDAVAADAKKMAAEADALHKAGKHAESEKLAKEALTKLGKM
jgi:hypothetical protein